MLLFGVLSAREGPHQSPLAALHQTSLAVITKILPKIASFF